MFTGIVQALGRIDRIEQAQGDVQLVVNAESLGLVSANIGDSIAVNGVCLTVTELHKNTFYADVSNETLDNTTLHDLSAGSTVNLEMAVRPSEPLGGHIVSGHVDGVGEVSRQFDDARSTRYEFTVPDDLARYIAKKGSVTVDGVSLTVNEVSRNEFSVNIIPHTQEVTLFGSYTIGSRVNIEVDVIARYVERLLTAGTSAPGSLSYATLAENGFAPSR
ncbi:MAG: riboflavin synthase [Pseudomonadota bacterium]